MKATKQYFPVVLFVMLCKAGLTFESVDEILKCDHANESFWAVFSCDAAYYAVQGYSNRWLLSLSDVTFLQFPWVKWNRSFIFGGSENKGHFEDGELKPRTFGRAKNTILAIWMSFCKWIRKVRTVRILYKYIFWPGVHKVRFSFVFTISILYISFRCLCCLICSVVFMGNPKDPSTLVPPLP